MWFYCAELCQDFKMKKSCNAHIFSIYNYGKSAQIGICLLLIRFVYCELLIAVCEIEMYSLPFVSFNVCPFDCHYVILNH